MRISFLFVLGLSVVLIGGCAGHRSGRFAGRSQTAGWEVFSGIGRRVAERFGQCDCESCAWAAVEASCNECDNPESYTINQTRTDANALVMIDGGYPNRNDSTFPAPQPLPFEMLTPPHHHFDDHDGTSGSDDDYLLTQGQMGLDLKLSEPDVSGDLSRPTFRRLPPVPLLTDESSEMQERSHQDRLAAAWPIPRPGERDDATQQTGRDGLSFSDGRNTIVRLSAVTPVGKSLSQHPIATIRQEEPRIVRGTHLLAEPVLAGRDATGIDDQPAIDQKRLNESLQRLTVRPTKNR